VKNSSYFDIQKTFLLGLRARDIAEPLKSFDAEAPAERVKSILRGRNISIAGIRQAGEVVGYIQEQELEPTGTCQEYGHPLEEGLVLEDSALMTELVKGLNQSPFVFIKLLGSVGGIVTRQDLTDPPVRMWLFGMITSIELRFLMLISQHYEDDSWMQYLSPSRIGKAIELQQERLRRNQEASLLDCLQFSDKAQIVARNETLRQQAGFISRRRADEVIKLLERLRNNLAHSQDIVAMDWDTIVAISENLERLIERSVR
jgi:hypothetical protein